MSDDDRSPRTYRLTKEQIREVERIQKQVRDGTAKFATDAEMAAFWKKCGLED